MYQGNEKLTYGEKELDFSIQNFWQWAYSDLIRNVNRGAFAEYIVKTALEFGTCDSSSTKQAPVRISMDAYDLLNPEGIRIEVKSSAYIQSWESEHPARISFRIAPAKTLDENENYSNKSIYARHSDIYIFCVWTAMSRDENILDLSLWDFYVLPTKTLNEKLPNQKTITFGSLLNLHPVKADFFFLSEAVKQSMKN